MKRLSGILLVALSAAFLCFALVGCGSGSNESDSAAEEPQAVEEPQAAEPVEQQVDKGPIALPLADSTSAGLEGDYELTRPVYKEDPETAIGEFCLTDYLSQAMMDEGWLYYYAESEGEAVERLEWVVPDDCYTAKVSVLFTNLKEEPVELSKRISGTVTFDQGGDSEESIECTFFQMNPGQLDADGYPIDNTKMFDSVQPGETIQFGFFADVPCADLDSDKPLVLTFTVDNGVQYEIDLRAELEDNLYL